MNYEALTNKINTEKSLRANTYEILIQNERIYFELEPMSLSVMKDLNVEEEEGTQGFIVYPSQ